MKIYDKRAFVAGVLFLCAIPFFAFGIIESKIWQIILLFGLAAKFLHTGLSHSESARQRYIGENYDRVAKELFGKYAIIKRWFPMILIGVFFAVAVFFRLVFDYITPVWIAIAVLIIATITTFYSIGLERQIIEKLDAERAAEDSEVSAN